MSFFKVASRTVTRGSKKPAPPSEVQIETSTSSTQINYEAEEPKLIRDKYGGQHFEHISLQDVFCTPGERRQEMEVNSLEGIPFESKIFKGQAIFKLRPQDKSVLSEEYQKYFGGYQRLFSLQIQGKFKISTEELKGKMIWIGCELGYEEPKLADENKMKLGFVRRTMCSLVLNAINMMRGAILHYSFGDEKQLPHISFPLYIAADTFVETSKNSSKKEEEAEGGGSTELEGCKTDDSKSGSPELEACKTDDSKKCEEPPPIGVAMFPEEEAGMKTRRKRNIKDIFSFKGGEEACYSFSLHNGNLDLFSWMVRGIPGVKPMDLTQYWRDLPLRIVAYMVAQINL